MTAAYHRDLNVPGTTFGPRPPKSSDGTLGGVPEPHSCVDDEVIEVAIAVQIDRDRVGVLVMIVKRSPAFVFACQFWAVNSFAVAHAADDGTMKQLRLGKCASARGQCGSVTTGSGQRQQHGRHRTSGLHVGAFGHPNLKRITSPPVEHAL